MDQLLRVILYGTLVALAVVEVGTLWFILKRRTRSAPGLKTEVAWTAVPAVVLLLITLGGMSR